MTSRPAHVSPSFTAKERELIRREFSRHFGQDPSIADGAMLRTCAPGSARAAQDPARRMDPERFAHLRRELGLDSEGDGDSKAAE